MRHINYGRPAFYAGIALLIIAGGIMGCNKAADDTADSGKTKAVVSGSQPVPKDLPPEVQERIKSAQAQDDARNKAAREQGAAMMAAQDKARQ